MSGYIWDYRDPYEWMNRVGRSSLPPLMICVAVSGGVQGKEANPNLPETPEELAESTAEAYRAGASLVHVHARDPEKLYNSAGSAEQYRLVNGLIREKCPDIVINNTTGGTWGMSVEERLSCLDARPEMATLNLGPDMFKMTIKARAAPLPHPRPEQRLDGCMSNTYGEVAAFARAMKERGIKPEMEMYQPGHAWVVHDIISQGLADPPYLIQFVLGYQTSSYATPANLLGLINELPPHSIFQVAGLGPYQLPMTVMGIILGGHVRVGMEDNVYLAKGRLLKSNAEMVVRIARVARDLNREIATPKQAREMLGLSPVPSRY
ncbi:MAG: 3-keto-5-aminohexanoate cleavage protein [Thermodesulfobacteriota bacterium]